MKRDAVTVMPNCNGGGNIVSTKFMEAMRSIFQNTETFIKYMKSKISEPITTNKGIRQRSGLSPLLFHIYSNKVGRNARMT
jgi:hypothetical protein